MSWVSDLLGVDVNTNNGDPYARTTGSGLLSMTTTGKLMDKAFNKKGDTKTASGMSFSEIDDLLQGGFARGEELVGINREDVAKNRSKVRDEYEKMLNAPSRGASRIASSRNADMKRLRQSQSQSGASGAMANAQRQQLTQDYAGKIGDQREKEYFNAITGMRDMAGADLSTILGVGGTYGSMGVASRPAPYPQQGGQGVLSGLVSGVI